MHNMYRLTPTALVCFGSLTLAAHASAELTYTGINSAGGEFNGSATVDEYGYQYIYPSASHIDYHMAAGANTFRLPFRWERLQPTLNGEFDATEFARLDGFVQHATSNGAYVVLDPHNYGRYRGGVIGSTVSNDDFADFWSRLADVYKDNDHVIFGLMNEPYSMPSTESWATSANAAIAGIRDTGASNLVLVPGNAFSGAHSWNSTWYGTANAQAMLSIVDPGNNYAFEAHQYLDSDSSGTSDEVISATIGSQRLAGFTQWLRDNELQGFLGEFAAPRSEVGLMALEDMLAYMDNNDDVWTGWTYWAGGPWWGEYDFTVEPNALGDRPQLAVLQDHYVVPEPHAALWLLLSGGLLLRRRRQHVGRRDHD